MKSEGCYICLCVFGQAVKAPLSDFSHALGNSVVVAVHCFKSKEILYLREPCGFCDIPPPILSLPLSWCWPSEWQGIVSDVGEMG